MESPSLRFAEAVRLLGREARRVGVTMPAFRSPPRLKGVQRSLRRRSDGGAVVAVVVRGRPWPAVLADLVDGVIAANNLTGAAADRARGQMWLVLGGDDPGVAASSERERSTQAGVRGAGPPGITASSERERSTQAGVRGAGPPGVAAA